MLKIYCDTGGYRHELMGMSQSGRIELVQFRYENRNKHIKSVAPPSKPTFDEMHYAYNELGELTFDDLGKQSMKIDEITEIIGPKNMRTLSTWTRHIWRVVTHSLLATKATFARRKRRYLIL